MALATAAAIRDQIYTLIEALTPTTLAHDKFRRYRNEGSADFTGWAEKNPSGALRRFQVRQVGDDGEPITSNTTEERVTVQYEVRIAYPQTARYGSANGMDRDDVRKEDWKLIKRAIGREARANFTSATDGQYDSTPLGASESRDSSGSIDFSVIRVEFEYVRATT